MELSAESRTVPEPIYDVVLSSRPPDALRTRFPTMSVRDTGTQTALRRRVNGTAQLDGLLEKLCSLGLPLLDVHRVSGGTGEEQIYELRVDGEVGEPLLRYLSWPHRVVPGETRVRIAAASNEFHYFLRACIEAGASIQRVHRLDSSPQHQAAWS